MSTVLAQLRTQDGVLVADIDVPWSHPPEQLILAGGRAFVHVTDRVYFEVHGWIVADLPAGPPRDESTVLVHLQVPDRGHLAWLTLPAMSPLPEVLSWRGRFFKRVAGNSYLETVGYGVEANEGERERSLADG